MTNDTQNHELTEPLDGADEIKQAASKTGRTAVAAVLAGSITAGAAAVTSEQIPLPDPVPIVHTIDIGGGVELPDSVVDDSHHADKSSWRKIIKWLLMALAALALVVGVILGALQGCISCAGPLAAPVDSSVESSSQTSH